MGAAGPGRSPQRTAPDEPRLVARVIAIGIRLAVVEPRISAALLLAGSFSFGSEEKTLHADDHRRTTVIRRAGPPSAGTPTHLATIVRRAVVASG